MKNCQNPSDVNHRTVLFLPQSGGSKLKSGRWPGMLPLKALENNLFQALHLAGGGLRCSHLEAALPLSLRILQLD